MSRKARMCSGIVAILITLSLHAAIAAPASSDQQKNDASPSFLLSGSDYSGLNAPSDSSTVESTTIVTTSSSTYGYKEISDFFNIREANSNVMQGEWELELEADWVTGTTGGDDDIKFTPNIKYGITDNLLVELEILPLNMGDGSNQGNGDLTLQLFYQFMHEADMMPAMAIEFEGRIPTGEGSSGVDGTMYLNVTKTIMPNLRAHFEGFVMTANGGRGDEDEGRRAFQWGVGPGIDYQCDDKTISTINYLMRSSEANGAPNQNILEIGMVRELASNQHLKLAVDVGVDGRDTTPNFGAKILWSYDW